MDTFTNKKLRFKVSGSTGSIYTITAEQKDGVLAVTCSCPAGEFGQACKHRIALVCGDYRSLESPLKLSLETFTAWIDGSDIEAAMARLNNAEAEYLHAKKVLKGEKKRLGRILEGS